MNTDFALRTGATDHNVKFIGESFFYWRIKREESRRENRREAEEERRRRKRMEEKRQEKKSKKRSEGEDEHSNRLDLTFLLLVANRV